MAASASDAPFPTGLGRSKRVAPIYLESLVTRDDSERLLRCAEVCSLSLPTRELAEHLVSLDPLMRFYHSLRVVMFRMMETAGSALPPCLAAEEQVFLEEFHFSGAPELVKATAARLLFLPERTAYARTLRQAVTHLA